VTGIVVADASPLIGLARIDRLDLLHVLYGTVVIPMSVLSELRVSSDRPGSLALTAALAEGAIEPRSLAAVCENELARLSQLLDAGEASAILLTEQLQARFLLIDERRGRQVARARGLPVVAVAGVLLAARRTGCLDSVGAALSDSLSRWKLRLQGLQSEFWRGFSAIYAGSTAERLELALLFSYIGYYRRISHYRGIGDDHHYVCGSAKPLWGTDRSLTAGTG